MDMKVRNKTFHDVTLIKAENTTRYPGVDHLVLEDEHGQDYWAAKRGLLNKEDGWAARGDTVEIGGKKLKAVHNVGAMDTKTEKALGVLDEALFRVQLAGLWCFARLQDLYIGLAGR